MFNLFKLRRIEVEIIEFDYLIFLYLVCFLRRVGIIVWFGLSRLNKFIFGYVWGFVVIFWYYLIFFSIRFWFFFLVIYM